MMEGGNKLQRAIGKYPCLSPDRAHNALCAREVELDIFHQMASW